MGLFNEYAYGLSREQLTGIKGLYQGDAVFRGSEPGGRSCNADLGIWGSRTTGKDPSSLEDANCVHLLNPTP